MRWTSPPLRCRRERIADQVVVEHAIAAAPPVLLAVLSQSATLSTRRAGRASLERRRLSPGTASIRADRSGCQGRRPVSVSVISRMWLDEAGGIVGPGLVLQSLSWGRRRATEAARVVAYSSGRNADARSRCYGQPGRALVAG